MTQPLATYSPDECMVVVGTLPISGFTDGTFISVEQNDPSFSVKPGADGEIARAKRVARVGSMKLTLLATSITNASLAALHESGEVFPILIKEGASVVFSAEAWVEKPAAFERGTDVGDCEWSFTLAHVSLAHAGNP